MKEDGFDIAMVYMIGARRGRHSARLMARSSNPAKSKESDNAFEGHEAPVTDEDAPPTNKNAGAMDSPVLRAIVDNVSLTIRSLKAAILPILDLANTLSSWLGRLAYH